MGKSINRTSGENGLLEATPQELQSIGCFFIAIIATPVVLIIGVIVLMIELI